MTIKNKIYSGIVGVALGIGATLLGQHITEVPKTRCGIYNHSPVMVCKLDLPDNTTIDYKITDDGCEIKKTKKINANIKGQKEETTFTNIGCDGTIESMVMLKTDNLLPDKFVSYTIDDRVLEDKTRKDRKTKEERAKLEEEFKDKQAKNEEKFRTQIDPEFKLLRELVIEGYTQ